MDEDVANQFYITDSNALRSLFSLKNLDLVIEFIGYFCIFVYRINGHQT